MALLAFWKEIAALSGVLYVFGFLVTRTRLNALGIHSELPISDSRYLSEGGRFLITTFEILLPWALVLLFVGGIAHVAMLAFGFSIRGQVARLEETVPRWAFGALHVFVVVVLSLLAQHTMNRGVALGLLVPDPGGARVDPEIEASLASDGAVAEHVYVLLFAVTTITGAIAVLLWKDRLGKAAGLLKAYALGLFALEVLMLPINFAVLTWEPRYPVVTLAVDEMPPLAQPTYLLFQVENELAVLSGGKLITIPRKKVSSQTTECYANVLARQTCPKTSVVLPPPPAPLPVVPGPAPGDVAPMPSPGRPADAGLDAAVGQRLGVPHEPAHNGHRDDIGF